MKIVRMEYQNEGILKKSIRGGIWMTLNTIAQRVLAIGTFFILARILTPEDFGIMAIIFLVPPLLDLALTMDFDTALIRSATDDPRQYYNAIWTINVLRSFIVFALVFVFGNMIAMFFHIENAAFALKLGGIFVLIQGLGNVAQLMFFKELDFQKVFVRDMLSRIAYSVVAVLLAWYLRSYWALFFANIALYATAVIATYVLCPFRPSFTMEWYHLKRFLGYSKWLYGQGILGELSGTLENMVIGRFLGATEVGLYTRAKALATTPTAPLMSVINKVGFPAYARLRGSAEKVKEGYLKSLDILMFIGIPFVVLTLAASRRLILIALGPQWIALDILFKILVVATVFQTIFSLSSALFNALGFSRFQLYVGILNTTIIAILIFILTPLYGVMGTAIAVLMNAGIMSLIVFYKTNRLVGVRVQDAINTISVPLGASLIVWFIGQRVIQFGDLGDTAFIALITALGIFYAALIWLGGTILKTGPYQTLLTVWHETKRQRV